MKEVDNKMVKNDDPYFPALLEALKALNQEKGGLRKITDTANLKVRENYVLTDEGEIPLSEVEGDELVLKIGELSQEQGMSEEEFVKSVDNYIKLKKINIPEITKREEIAFTKEEINENTRYYAGSLNPEDVEIFKRIKGPTYIEGKVDMRGTDITEIPKGVSFGGDVNFRGCTSLTTISEGVSFGGYADFRGCSSLTKETIEKLKQWKVEGKIPGILWLPDGTSIY